MSLELWFVKMTATRDYESVTARLTTGTLGRKQSNFSPGWHFDEPQQPFQFSGHGRIQRLPQTCSHLLILTHNLIATDPEEEDKPEGAVWRASPPKNLFRPTV
jgi:hypothetical protein